MRFTKIITDHPVFSVSGKFLINLEFGLINTNRFGFHFSVDGSEMVRFLLGTFFGNIFQI